MLRLSLCALTLLVSGGPALAHEGELHAGWTLDPVLVVPLLLALVIWVVGAWRLWHRSSEGRPAQRRSAVRFIAGWAVLALTLTSPLHEAGEQSFALHMIEHELIMLVATLLLAASHAGGAIAWGLPKPLRQVGAWWHRLADPVTATVLQGAVMWLWHLPSLFDLAVENRTIHILQHASFILASLLFWWAMLRVPRSSYGVAAACLFVTSLIGGALGALMAVSESPWYAPYAAMQLSGIGLTPAADQQLAGLIMWIPGGLVHAGAALLFFYKWLKTAEASHGAALR